MKALINKYKKPFIVSNIVVTICIFITVFSYSSCSKDIAKTSQPIAALIDTLKLQDPDCSCLIGLSEYTWKGDTVYSPRCGPFCDCVLVLYNSNAQQLTLDSTANHQFLDQSVFIRIVWSCN